MDVLLTAEEFRMQNEGGKMPLSDFKLEAGDTFDLVIKDISVRYIGSQGVISVDGMPSTISGYTRVVSCTDPRLTAENVRRAEKLPEHWPPRADDVWENDTGGTYHCVTSLGGDLVFINNKSAGHTFSPDIIRKTHSLKLVYRSGNVYRKVIT